MMIRNLFLPEKIGNYFLFKKRVLSISISKQTVTGTLLMFYAKNCELLGSYTEKIFTGEDSNNTIEISNALSKIIKTASNYDEIILNIDSSYAIFKDLTIPLLDEEKIAQILKFELENYLPFSINDAIYDFIILQQNIDSKSSDLFTVILPKDRIDYYINICTQAGFIPNKITLDVFNIFALHTFINSSNLNSGSQFIIFHDNIKTSILYIENKALKKIRILQELPSINNELWWNNLSFTFESCINNWENEVEIFFYGPFDQTIIEETKLKFNKNCSSITIDEIIKKTSIIINNINFIHETTVQNLSSTFQLSLLENFNLLPQSSFLMTSLKSMFKYFVGISLLVMIYGSLIIHAFVEIRKISTKTEMVSEKIIKDLKKALPMLKTNSLNEALRKSKAEISKEEEIWFSFSSQTQHSFLTYLFELSTLIDRDTLGLNLKKMNFNKNGILLEGSVRSFDAVEEFIKQLKNTNLFTQIPNLQKTEFSFTLPLVDSLNRGEKI